MPSPSTNHSFKPPTISSSSPWTLKDRTRFKKACQEFNEDWLQIQLLFPDRTLRALQICWKRLNQPSHKQLIDSTQSAKDSDKKAQKKWSNWSKWHVNEDAKFNKILEGLIRRKREINWEDIAKQFTGKTEDQCRYHYQNYLDPSIYKGAWTSEEDEIILTMMQESKRSSIKVVEAIKNKMGWKRTTKRIYSRWERITGNTSKLKRKRREEIAKQQELDSQKHKIKKVKQDEVSSSALEFPLLETLTTSILPPPPMPTEWTITTPPESIYQSPMDAEADLMESKRVELIHEIFQNAFVDNQKDDVSPSSLLSSEHHHFIFGEDNFALPMSGDLVDPITGLLTESS